MAFPKLLARSAAALAVLSLAAAASRPVAADPALPAKGEVEVKAFTVAGSDAPKIVVRAVMDLPPNAMDIEFLRTFPKLERISFRETPNNHILPTQTAAEFWQEYDAGKTGTGK